MPTPEGYSILAELGRGGMGVVYKARQEGLNRLVALKMIRDPSTARPGHLERFRIEAEAVARLRHPNIIQVFDVGEAAGIPYFSLELLEGGNLAERVAGTPQAAGESASLMATLAGAVHAAHQAGIVHRDLKPQNVLFDRDGTPKVADFGLAKRLEVEGGLTLTDEVMGTPAYMAPEQALGRNREVGPAADIYALGAILYTMLTGRPPLQGTTWRETISMVIDRDPVAPSKLQPKIPRDLETIALKCLAKDPRRRYASGHALAEDLSRFLEGRPVLARRTPPWERAWKMARRHPAKASIAAIGLVAAIGLGWAAERRSADIRRQGLREGRRIEEARRAAGDGLLKGRERVARGELEGAREDLARLETSLQDEPRLGDLRAEASAALAEARRRLDDRARREADRGRLDRFGRLVDEAMFLAFTTGLDPSERADQARDPARAALSVFGTFDGTGAWSMGAVPDSFEPARRQEVASGCYQMLMVLAEATARPLPGEDPRRQATEALALLDRASALGPPTRSLLARRAAFLEQVGKAEAARIARAEAARMEPAGAFDHQLLGQQLYGDGDVQGALRQFAAALQEEPDLFWPQCLTAICSLNASPPRPAEAWASLNPCLQRRPDYAWLYLLRGLASGELGALQAAAGGKPESEARFADAEADFRKALATGLDANLRYVLLINRGVMRSRGGRAAEAVADFEAAIALDPARHNAHFELAKALGRLGRRAEAIGQLDLAIKRKPARADLYRERARLRGVDDAPAADLDEALRDLERAIRLDPPGGRDSAEDHVRRGLLLLRLGRPREARDACDSALAIAPGLLEAGRYRAVALLRLGEFDEALGCCDAALASGPPSAEMHQLRGLARVGRNDFAGAIEDYSRALALRPDRLPTLLYRGRAYLFANSPELALRDFEEAVSIAPDEPEGYSGRAAAKTRLRRHRDATLDAEESLRRREPTPERLYDAARTYAQSAAVASGEVARRGRPALLESAAYESRAAGLLALALDRTPPDRRERFWREIVERDDSMARLRKRLDLARRVKPATAPAP